MQPSSIFSGLAHRELLHLLEHEGDLQGFFIRFSERYIHIKQLGIERNTYLNWENGGLIPYKRSEKGGWRKFSLIEAAWIKTIQEMRAMGVPTETIRKVKDWLFSIPGHYAENILNESHTAPHVITNQQVYVDKMNEQGAKGIKKALEEAQLNVFSLSLMRTLLQRMVHLIVLYKGGEIILFPLPSPTQAALGPGVEEAQHKFLTESATVINLWSVLQQVAFSERLELKEEVLFYFLSEEEKRILLLIKDKQYSEVIVQKDSKGMPTHVRLTKKGITPQEMKKLLPYLKRGAYQSIQFKTRDGQLIHYEETSVVRLGKQDKEKEPITKQKTNHSGR